MLTETGRIMAVDKDHLWVETINRSTCGSCVAEKGCGQSLLARWAAKSAYMKVLLDGRDPRAFNINDTVSIGIPEDVVVKSSLIIYCLPILLLLVGGAIGQYTVGSENASILAALTGLLVGGLLVKLYSWSAGRNRRLQPVIVDVLTRHG
ncbi:MAG: SoxR reducing system RseC family protein [Cellvibrionaceae bacterium]